MNDEHSGPPCRGRGVRTPSLPSGESAALGRRVVGRGSTSFSGSDSVSPIPASVVALYMGIVSIAILAYVSSSQERREEFSRPLVRFMTEKRYTALLCRDGRRHSGARGCERLRPDERAPRAALLSANDPSGITSGCDGPRQEDRPRCGRESLPATRRRRTRNNSASMSRTVAASYYRNCVFCHGDTLAGNGMFVHGLDPIPTNFVDQGAIAMLRDTFLFWRIAKGGRGFPRKRVPGTRPCRPGRSS